MRNIDKYAKAWREVLGKSYCAYYPEGDDSARQYFYMIGILEIVLSGQGVNSKISRGICHIWPDPEDENNLWLYPSGRGKEIPLRKSTIKL